MDATMTKGETTMTKKELENTLRNMTTEEKIEMNRRAYASVATYLLTQKGATKDGLRGLVNSRFNELSDGEKGEHKLSDAKLYVSAIYEVAVESYKVHRNVVIGMLAKAGVR